MESIKHALLKTKGAAALLVGALFLSIAPAHAGPQPSKQVLPATADLCIYGGNCAGVTAAVQAARMGRSVILIEPGKHLGGLTSGGLGFVDVGAPTTVGGLSREYFHRVWQHYQSDKAWQWEKKRAIKGQHPPLSPGDETMWVVEPGVAEGLFEQFISEAKVTVFRGERLDRTHGVKKVGSRINSITMESGRVFVSRMFIDASYEGDLMAAAGVSYTIGREPNSRYGETINGINNVVEISKPIDPYLVKGSPSSGLLPRVHPSIGGKKGDGDSGLQAYNFRMCLTRVPENRVMVEKPAGYDEKEYEIVFRAIEAGMHKPDPFLKLSPIPNKKTDTNNNGPISTDLVGVNWNYPESDYATREKFARTQELWQRGLIWTLQNHPRVPAGMRERFAAWGLAKDEFNDNHNWPTQLYVREARRMVGDYVVTENTALGKEPARDPVGLGSYHMDSHIIKYFVDDKGLLQADGGMFFKIPKPFPISYRAIVPKAAECTNLLVPVCLSATHAAYGSLRMEPIFMVLGQSAATAASLAIEDKVDVQKVEYQRLRARLEADKQVLE